MDEAISPYVRRAMYHVMEPGAVVTERVIFDYEILLVKGGSVTFTIDRTVYNSEVGDIFIFRPGQRHSTRVAAKIPFIQPHVHFDLLYRSNREEIPVCFKNLNDLTEIEKSYIHPDILDRYLPNFPARIRPKNPKGIELALFDLISEFDSNNIHKDVRLSYYFLRMWELILNEVTYNLNIVSGSRKDNAERVKLYIEQHAARPISIRELVDLTHYSQAYIFKIFNEAYGISPIQYHMLMRVQKAKAMIMNTTMSLSDISEHLEFANIQDFSRAFKKVDGCSPSSYRRSKPE